VGGGGISSLNRSARASRQILIGINIGIYNYILRIDSKKNTRLRELKCGNVGFMTLTTPIAVENILTTSSISWTDCYCTS